MRKIWLRGFHQLATPRSLRSAGKVKLGHGRNMHASEDAPSLVVESHSESSTTRILTHVTRQEVLTASHRTLLPSAICIALIKFLMHEDAPHHLPPQWDGNRETRHGSWWCGGCVTSLAVAPSQREHRQVLPRSRSIQGLSPHHLSPGLEEPSPEKSAAGHQVTYLLMPQFPTAGLDHHADLCVPTTGG